MVIQFLILQALVSSALVGFLAALIGGIFIAPPKTIANNLSPAFYIGGAISGFMFGTTLGENLILILVGAAGGIIGWLIYGGIALRSPT